MKYIYIYVHHTFTYVVIPDFIIRNDNTPPKSPIKHAKFSSKKISLRINLKIHRNIFFSLHIN